MKPEPENSNQDELQRMLALKRHEQPPRNFFPGFSQKVMDRLQNPEPPPEPTLLQRLGLDFDTKPVLICLSGLAVCGSLAFALISARSVKAPPQGPHDPLAPRPVRAGATTLEGSGLMATPAVTQEQSVGGSEPVIISPDSGFRIPPRPRPAPVPPANPGK